MTITESGSGSAASSDPTTIRPFTVEIPQAEVDDMYRRVRETRLPERETVGDASQGVQLDVNRAETSRVGSYGAVAFGLIFFGFAGLALFRVVTGRVPTLEKARTVDPEEVTVTFKDVAGVDEAKDEVSEIVDC